MKTTQTITRAAAAALVSALLISCGGESTEEQTASQAALQIKGAGVDGKLTLGDSDVLVSVSLGLLASPFKNVLRNEVQRFLDEYVT